jgi:hypothetical protein
MEPVAASNALSHELNMIGFHALSDEGRKAPGLVLREMQVVRGDRVFTAGAADCEPTWASTEGGLAVNKGSEGM